MCLNTPHAHTFTSMESLILQNFLCKIPMSSGCDTMSEYDLKRVTALLEELGVREGDSWLQTQVQGLRLCMNANIVTFILLPRVKQPQRNGIFESLSSKMYK